MIIIEKEWDGVEREMMSDSSGNQWSIPSVIEATKELPVMNVPLDHLCISRSIAGVSMRSFVAHMKMVLDADLDFPIILDDNGEIFDGAHRVAKALLEGKETIKAVRFARDPAPTIAASDKK